MSRIRSIHPEQWTDENFIDCTPLARLLAIALRNEADDGGVFEWKPRALKMRLLPADNCNVDALLEELITSHQVTRFEVDGHHYGAIRNFTKFQKPKFPKYRHPQPPGLPEPRASHDPPFPRNEETGPPAVAKAGAKEGEENSRTTVRSLGARIEKSAPDEPDEMPEIPEILERREANGHAKNQRGTRLSADWQPDEKDRSFAVSLGLDVDRIGPEFRDYWVAVAGAKAVKLDWSATFRNRCRAIAERSGTSARRLEPDDVSEHRGPRSPPPLPSPEWDPGEIS